MRRTVIFFTAAATVTGVLTGCSSVVSHPNQDVAASAVAETNSSVPTPRPSYRTTVYTLVSGEQVQIRSDEPVPDVVVADIQAKSTDRVRTIENVGNGFDQQPAINSLAAQANEDYDAVGRTVMYFFGILEASGSHKWGVLVSGTHPFPAANLASNDRAEALTNAERFAEQQRALLVVMD